MKVSLLSFLVLMISAVSFAQSNSQVKWTWSAKKIADKTYEVHMTATVTGNWHIYSQNVGVDGPIPTSFTFTKNPLVTMDGTPKELGKLIKKNEEVWGGEVHYYENKVDFIQVVKVKGSAKTNVAGKVEYMVCNDEKCLPPSENTFSVAVGG
ncbi:MAG TPA: protein-disulfide reductase DsbD domain-containing protein [Niastella sp.]